MYDDIEEKKKDLKERLESDLFVDRYSTFKESVELINMALETFNVKYQYTYNEFCIEFTNECLRYIDGHPDANMLDPEQMMVYTMPIVMNMINNAKNKYGYDKLYSQETE